MASFSTTRGTRQAPSVPDDYRDQAGSTPLSDLTPRADYASGGGGRSLGAFLDPDEGAYQPGAPVADLAPGPRAPRHSADQQPEFTWLADEDHDRGEYDDQSDYDDHAGYQGGYEDLTVPGAYSHGQRFVPLAGGDAEDGMTEVVPAAGELPEDEADFDPEFADEHGEFEQPDDEFEEPEPKRLIFGLPVKTVAIAGGALGAAAILVLATVLFGLGKHKDPAAVNARPAAEQTATPPGGAPAAAPLPSPNDPTLNPPSSADPSLSDPALNPPAYDPAAGTPPLPDGPVPGAQLPGGPPLSSIPPPAAADPGLNTAPDPSLDDPSLGDPSDPSLGGPQNPSLNNGQQDPNLRQQNQPRTENRRARNNDPITRGLDSISGRSNDNDDNANTNGYNDGNDTNNNSNNDRRSLGGALGGLGGL